MVVSSSGVKFSRAVVGHSQAHLVMHCKDNFDNLVGSIASGGAGPLCAEVYMFSAPASSHSAGTCMRH